MPESLNFDRVADRYDETRGGEERGEQFAVDIAKLLRTGHTVLEVGVGTGVIAKALAKRGFTVVGVDISAQMLERARERVGPRVAQADALSLPIATGSIDQLVAVWVLHVVGDVAQVLREFARVLRPDGHAFVVDGKAIYEPDDPISVAYRELEDALDLPPRLGKVHEWAALAPDAGLRVERIVDAGPHPFTTSIADHADFIATRGHSWMWPIPDDTWERAATPVLERLRALPNFAEPLQLDGYQEILVVRNM